MNMVILIGIPAALFLTCFVYSLTDGVSEPQRGAGLSVFAAVLIMLVLVIALYSVPGMEVQYTV